MSLISTPHTVAVLRPAFNPSTKQSTVPTPVSGLSAVPCWIQAIGGKLRAQGFSPKYELSMKWNPDSDGTTKIRDGDYITGWNPKGLANPGTFIVQHAEYHEGLPFQDYWMCYLMALEPAGSAF